VQPRALANNAVIRTRRRRGDEFLQDIYIAAPRMAVSRTDVWLPSAAVGRVSSEVKGMDIIYLLILAGLYAVTHGLIWALGRLGKAP
jgi:hypothetical protein